MQKRFTLLLAILLLAVAGCSVPAEQWIALPLAAPEVPPMNPPIGMRQTNWVSATGSGSCVIASSVTHFRWQNQEQLAQKFRASYAGGQTASSIKQKWRDANIPFIAHENGDPSFLEWASKTRRGAIIWYFPNHCVNFCGYSMIDGREHAMLCDNNRITNYIRIPKDQFIRDWRGYGGFACTALLSPAPSLPHAGFKRSAK